MNRDSVQWQGNICAIVTPFNRDGSMDEQSFRENIRLLMSEGVDGIVVAGCTGEFWSLDDDERLRLFDMAMEEAGGKIVVIGNASAIRTSDSIRYARAVKERGLDGIMLTPPFYARPGEREILAHYQAVSDAVKLPILLYNIPSRQAVQVPMNLLLQLCEVDTVVAIKQSAAAFQDVMETLRLCKEKLRILPGHSVDRGVPSVLMGADGYVSSVEPQILGREAISMYALTKSGNLEEAQRVQFRCIELDHAIHGGAGTFPASLKAAMNMLGRPGGYPREPLLSLTDDEEKKVRHTLKSLNLL